MCFICFFIHSPTHIYWSPASCSRSSGRKSHFTFLRCRWQPCSNHCLVKRWPCHSRNKWSGMWELAVLVLHWQFAQPVYPSIHLSSSGPKLEEGPLGCVMVEESTGKKKVPFKTCVHFRLSGVELFLPYVKSDKWKTFLLFPSYSGWSIWAEHTICWDSCSIFFSRTRDFCSLFSV